MNHLLSSFRSFKQSLVPETTLNRRKSIAFIKMFKRANMRVICLLIILFLIPRFSGVLKAQTKYPYSGTDVTTQYKDKGKAVVAKKAITPKDPIPKDSVKKYSYFVVIPVSDYQQLANALNEYKRLSMYDPAATDAQKVAVFKGIEAYLKELPGRLKVDSVVKK